LRNLAGNYVTSKHKFIWGRQFIVSINRWCINAAYLVQLNTLSG